MTQILVESPPEVLEERLARGAELLFGMEQRGDRGEQYQRWLAGWVDLLGQYESLATL